jgi:type IV pilus assembly protein PilC
MAASKATAAAQTRMRQNQMGQFIWEGTDKRGQKMKGESQSKSANLVRAELRKQGITPIVVREKKKPMFGAAGSRISALEIATFSRQIATMLQSGVPMVQSFEILAGGQKNERMRVMLSDIRDSISGAPPCTNRSAATPCSSTTCTATWSRPAKAPACWTACSTRWPPTRNASRP